MYAGLDDGAGGFGADAGGAVGILEDEYLAPEASPTFWTIDSGERSDSDRAVTCTW